MRADADVLVVGAGPAGSVAATLLARAGARVRLLDRVDFPRGKLCGDSLNPGALSLLRRLHLPLDERAGIRIGGMRVTGPSAVIDGHYPDGIHGLILSRQRLDAILLGHALAAGVHFEPGAAVTAAVCREGAVTGVELAGRGGPERRLHAPVIIAADGRQSRLAHSLGLLRPARSPRRWAIGGYVEGAGRPDGDVPFGEMHIRASGYLGVAPLPDGQTNVCVVTSQVGRRLQRPGDFLLAAFRDDPRLADRMRDIRLTTAVSVLGPLAVEPTGQACDGLLAAGDAAGFVDPMTGDGLRLALAGAELAAHAAQRALLHGWSGVHAELACERRRQFARKWRFNRALRTLVSSPASIRAASMSARVAPSLVRLLIAYAGDVRLAGAPESNAPRVAPVHG